MNTQCETVLKHLTERGSITPWEAIQEYRITRLGARIWDLKQAGHPIDDELVRQNGKKFSRYFLAKKNAPGVVS